MSALQVPEESGYDEWEDEQYQKFWEADFRFQGEFTERGKS